MFPFACIVWMSLSTVKQNLLLYFKVNICCLKGSFCRKFMLHNAYFWNGMSGLGNSHCPAEEPSPESWSQAISVLLSCSCVHIGWHTQTLNSHLECWAEQVDPCNTPFESTEVGKCLDCRDVVWVRRYTYKCNKWWKVNGGRSTSNMSMKPRRA